MKKSLTVRLEMLINEHHCFPMSRIHAGRIQLSERQERSVTNESGLYLFPGSEMILQIRFPGHVGMDADDHCQSLFVRRLRYTYKYVRRENPRDRGVASGVNLWHVAYRSYVMR